MDGLPQPNTQLSGTNRWPYLSVGQQRVDLEIAQGKRNPVIYPKDCRVVLSKQFYKPMGNALAGPVYLRGLGGGGTSAGALARSAR